MTYTLLLADDEEGIRKVLGIALADSGYHVLTAADGASALEVFRRERPAIVLTDLRMPGIDGIELLRTIKTERPETEVIMITGHGDMELAIESLKLEATDFVTKPINDDVLAIALKRACERIEMRAQLRAYTENLEQRVQQQASRLIEVERLAAVGQAVEGIATALRGMSGPADGSVHFLNEMPCLLSIHDRAPTVVGANTLFRDRLGDWVGSASREHYQDATVPGFVCPVDATLASGRGQSGSYVLKRRDGGRVPVLVHTVPIRSSRGEPELVMELALDVSEMTRLREELRSAQERLASLGLMVGSVSHGVKGILTGMDAGLYLAESALRRRDFKQAQEGIGTVKEMVARIRRVALDVLYFAKERPLAWSRIDAGVLSEQVVGLARARIGGTGIELVLQAPADAGTIEADESAVTAAFLNLLDNAVDACRLEHTRAAHRVTLRVVPAADHVRFDVADDGVGMTAETRQKAFDLFYSSKGSSGTGFGLFIARQVVLRHGGRISFESTEGVGTVLRIELPRTLPESAKRAGS